MRSSARALLIRELQLSSQPPMVMEAIQKFAHTQAGNITRKLDLTVPSLLIRTGDKNAGTGRGRLSRACSLAAKRSRSTTKSGNNEGRGCCNHCSTSTTPSLSLRCQRFLVLGDRSTSQLRPLPNRCGGLQIRPEKSASVYG